MQQKDITAILERIQSGNYTPEEETIAKYWLHQLNQKERTNFTEAELDEVSQEMWLKILQNQQPVVKIKRLWPQIAAAASILIFLSFGAYFLFNRNNTKPQIAKNTIHDIAPGSNKAILTLANGKTIVLNTSQRGLLAKQGASAINRSANGELVYQKTADNETTNAAVAYNSITIPRGAEYQVVVLPDGTKVWINSASSLRYPTAFAGNERKVELTGEAYFEVVHNPAKPFRVVSNNQTVEVLGTHFNINAYDDEPAVKTTLLEGKIKLTAADNSIRYLLPGQQATLNSTAFTVKPVETDEAIAWKNGKFMFRSESVEVVMRQISRWYNVNIIYKDNVADKEIWGTVDRYGNVSEVLDMVELTGVVHFQVTGRSIIVSK